MESQILNYIGKQQGKSHRANCNLPQKNAYGSLLMVEIVNDSLIIVVEYLFNLVPGGEEKRKSRK